MRFTQDHLDAGHFQLQINIYYLCFLILLLSLNSLFKTESYFSLKGIGLEIRSYHLDDAQNNQADNNSDVSCQFLWGYLPWRQLQGNKVMSVCTESIFRLPSMTSKPENLCLPDKVGADFLLRSTAIMSPLWIGLKDNNTHMDSSFNLPVKLNAVLLQLQLERFNLLRLDKNTSGSTCAKCGTNSSSQTEKTWLHSVHVSSVDVQILKFPSRFSTKVMIKNEMSTL